MPKGWADFSAVARPFRNRNYAMYTAGNAISNTGTWIQRLAVGWLAWQLTESAFWVAAVSFADFFTAAEAVRALSQSGLNPANCRLVDANECKVNGVNDGSAHLLVLGFESAHYDVGPKMQRALEILRDHAGTIDGGERAVGAWRNAFIRMPYFREVITPW